MKAHRPAAWRRVSPIAYAVAALSVVGAVLLALVGPHLWYTFNGPPVPLADTSRADPQVARAIDEARSAVTRRPASADAWGHLGKVYRAHEFEPEAGACFARAETLDDSDPRWPYLLAAGLRTRDPQAAEAAYLRSARLGGIVVTPSVVLGEILLDQGRTGEAEPLFLDALEREPRNPRALYALGRMLADRGDYERALDQLKLAVLVAPEWRAPRSLLAHIYGRVGEQESAAREILTAAKLSPQVIWPDAYEEEVRRVRVPGVPVKTPPPAN